MERTHRSQLWGHNCGTRVRLSAEVAPNTRNRRLSSTSTRTCKLPPAPDRHQILTLPNTSAFCLIYLQKHIQPTQVPLSIQTIDIMSAGGGFIPPHGGTSANDGAIISTNLDRMRIEERPQRQALTVKQERRLVDYLEERFMELMRGFKKRYVSFPHCRTLLPSRSIIPLFPYAMKSSKG